MLHAQGDLEGLRPQIHAVIHVEIHSGLIHLQQAVNGLAEASAGVVQVGVCLGGQAGKVDFALAGVLPEVQEYPAARQHFLQHQQVNPGGAIPGFAHVEGPLIALEEHHREHLAHISQAQMEEFAGVIALRVGGDEPGQGLHVGAGDVPSGLHGGQAELPLGQVAAQSARRKGHARRAVLAGGVDAV